MNPKPYTLNYTLGSARRGGLHAPLNEMQAFGNVTPLGCEVTREKKYRLLFHNGSLSVAAPQKSIQVWYSSKHSECPGVRIEVSCPHQWGYRLLSELLDPNLPQLSTQSPFRQVHGRECVGFSARKELRNLGLDFVGRGALRTRTGLYVYAIFLRVSSSELEAILSCLAPPYMSSLQALNCKPVTPKGWTPQPANPKSPQP